MDYTVRYDYVPSGKHNIKCPYSMNAEYVTVHNTANDASAANEVSYMKRNDYEVSYHVAVDDKEAVIAVPFDRNAWHAGDGNGKGNRTSIGVEICYSKSGGEKFLQAERNAAHFVAGLLLERGWGVDRMVTHQHWSGKYCPHRTLDMGWKRFVEMVEYYMEKGEEEMAVDIREAVWGKEIEGKRADELLAILGSTEDPTGRGKEMNTHDHVKWIAAKLTAVDEKLDALLAQK